ncbi:uncharacterized protein LOC112573701 [Pomacea canaliculata]|uniref:uncharacterized protein LOC112573701 n=1 Tax=Pomacea canaliculata TaxID=400727 RepID=UPI000D73597D|nr:uncharacterized protein LOC112573701 [Pomacea canaliculata]
MCDVFSSRRTNFDYFDNGIVYTATVEAYFLYDGVDMAVGSYETSQTNVPLRVELTIPALNKDIVFNIFDFDTDRPEFEVFDVTSCFDSSAKLDFRVRFPGTYNSDTEHIVKLKGQNLLAQTLQVSPLRVTHVQIEYDGSYLYLLASLLDRTPSLGKYNILYQKCGCVQLRSLYNNLLMKCACVAVRSNLTRPAPCCAPVQFTRLMNKVIEQNDDSQFANISSAAACSDLCVQNPEFQCKSFEYCPNDRQGCRLSRSHISDGGVSVVPSQCDLYSRTVNPLNTIEPSIEDAYSNMLNKLWTPDFALIIPQDDQSEITYVAIASEILFGIAFDIDARQGNCTIHPIQNFGDFDAQVLNVSMSGVGIDMVSMKSPSQLFHLDNTYKYTGQKTVRGILCDVFESARTDFQVGGNDGNTQYSIFQYFFQASDWSYIADNHNDVTMQAPVMLTLSDTEANTYLIYNFFDFNDQHLTYQNFDVSPCFSDKQRIDFVIDFNQTYYPYLATGEWSFKEQAQLQLSSLLRITPLRLQDLQVTYNSGQTFLIGTLLDYVPPQFYFIEDGSTAPYHATQLVPNSNVISCANACYDLDDLCNSFDYCSDGNCLLSTLRVPDGNATGQAENCRHFSRLTNATYLEPPLDKAYDIMKDVIYKGLLVIQIPITGNESQIAIYPATGIRNDILRSKPPSNTEEGDFNKFTVTTHDMMLFNSRLVLSGIAVDDCASACLNEQFFDCEAFDYCYTVGDCYLYDIWSDDPRNLDIYSSCDIFRRLYTDEFTEYPGQILESAADAILKASSVEMCAKECFMGIGYHNTCRSFDFCPSTNDCLIRHVHMMDVELSSVGKSSTCTHYSRNYLYDFDKMTNKELPGHDDMIFKDVSPPKCAGLCLDDLNCQSFEFCAGECHLSSTSAKLNPNVTVSGTCDLYLMQDSAKVVDRAQSGAVSVPAARSSPSTSKVLLNQSTSQPADRATTITSQVPLAGATSVPATKSIPLTSKTLSSHSTSMASTPVTNNQNYKLTSVQTSPPTNTNNGKGCKQQKAGGSSNDTGPRTAIAFGVLILGIVVGSVSMHLFFRFRVGRPGGDTMELFSDSR